MRGAEGKFLEAYVLYVERNFLNCDEADEVILIYLTSSIVPFM
jgi:hypothetical protein